MIVRYIFISLCFLLLSQSISSQSIDSENSIVSFDVSNMRLNNVEGTFKGLKGDVNFNPDQLADSSFDVCIDASTINTGISKRDQHLKNEDFFHIDKFPEICFESKQITKTESAYVTKGVLTMHGVSKNIEIPFIFNNNELLGEFNINRLDYKIGEGTGSFMVGKEINVKIKAVLKE